LYHLAADKNPAQPYRGIPITLEAAEKVGNEQRARTKVRKGNQSKRITRWPEGQHYPKWLFSAASLAVHPVSALPNSVILLSEVL
jgi:hypothetical protein